MVRAKDAAAPNTLLRWADRAEYIGAEERMVAMVRNGAREMVDWQREHGCQIPNLPEE